MTRIVSLARNGLKGCHSLRWKLVLHAAKIEKIKRWKAQQNASGPSFKDHPRVSLIVQSFNQAQNIDALEPRLRLTCADELIVCEDGSIDGSHEQWMTRLNRPNDFLVHSNNIHEIRAYSRAIDHARGEFICLLQDDDRPPKDGSWLSRGLDFFTYYPKLAVLGGWCGFNGYFTEAWNCPWLPPGEGEIPYIDPYTRMPLMFVENVNIGPYLLRKTFYRGLGGFDWAFSTPGTPGITFESEFCYRAWKHGYQVALTDMPVKIMSPGGTLLWGYADRQRNEIQNKRRIVELHNEDLPAIQDRVKQANDQLISTMRGHVCTSSGHSVALRGHRGGV
jgi:hypothetical protein